MSLADESALSTEVSPTAALWGLALFTAGIALTPLLFGLARRFVPRRGAFFARWGFAHLAIAIAVFVAASVVAVVLGRSVGSVLDPILVQLAAGSVGWGVAGLLMLRWAARLDPDGVRALGLTARGLGRGLALAMVCFALLLPALQTVGLPWIWSLRAVGFEPEVQAALRALGGLHGGSLVFGFVLAVGVVPFLEELSFRGFLQPLLVQNLGDRGGVVLTSLLFAGLHGATAFMTIFCLSLLLGALRLQTGNLWPSVAVHVLFNGLNLALLELGGAAP